MNSEVSEVQVLEVEVSEVEGFVSDLVTEIILQAREDNDVPYRQLFPYFISDAVFQIPRSLHVIYHTLFYRLPQERPMLL
jgi:hypothetical protein